jgi:hypothetical protein
MANHHKQIRQAIENGGAREILHSGGRVNVITKKRIKKRNKPETFEHTMHKFKSLKEAYRVFGK